MSKVSKHEENDVKRFGHPGLLWAPWRRRPIQALLSAVVFGFLLVAGVRVVGALMRRGGDRDAVRDPRLFRHHTDHRLLTVQSMNEDQAVFCSRAGVHWYDRRSQHLRLYPVADGVPRDVFYDGTNLLSTLYDGSIVDLRSGRMLFRAEPTIPQSDLTWKALDAHGSRLFQVAADPSDPSDPSDPHALVIDKATGNARAVCLYPDKLPREKLDESLKSWAGDSTYRRWMYPDDPNKGDGIPISLRGKKDISPARLERMLSVSRWDKPWVACIERLAARALPSLCAQPDVRDAWFTDGHLFVATKLGIVCLSEDGSPADRRMQHQWTLETQPCPSLDNDTLKGITQVRMVKIDDGSVRGVAIGADGRLYLHTGNGGWVPQHHARTFESYSADDLKACFGNPKYGRLLAVTAEDVALYDLSERRWNSIVDNQKIVSAKEVNNRIWLAIGDATNSIKSLQTIDWNGIMADPVVITNAPWKAWVVVGEKPLGLTQDGVLCRSDKTILFEGSLPDVRRDPLLFTQVDDGLVAVDQSCSVWRYRFGTRSWTFVSRFTLDNTTNGFKTVRVVRTQGNTLAILGETETEHSRVEVLDLDTPSWRTVWAGNAPPFGNSDELRDVQCCGNDFGVLTANGACWYYTASHGHWQQLNGAGESVQTFLLSSTANRVALLTSNGVGRVVDVLNWKGNETAAQRSEIASIAGCREGIFSFHTTDHAAWVVGRTKERLLGGEVKDLVDRQLLSATRLADWPREAYRCDFVDGMRAYYDREWRMLTPFIGEAISGGGSRFLELDGNKREQATPVQWGVTNKAQAGSLLPRAVPSFDRKSSDISFPSSGAERLTLRSTGDRRLGFAIRQTTDAGVNLDVVIEKDDGELHYWQIKTPLIDVLTSNDLALLRFPELPRYVSGGHADAVLTWSNGCCLVNTLTGQTFPWPENSSKAKPVSMSEMRDGRSFQGLDGNRYYVERTSGYFARAKDLGGWMAPLHRVREFIRAQHPWVFRDPLSDLKKLWLALAAGDQFNLADDGKLTFGGARLPVADKTGYEIPFAPTMRQAPPRVESEETGIPFIKGMGTFSECVVKQIVPESNGFLLDTETGRFQLNCSNGNIDWPLREDDGREPLQQALTAKTVLPPAWFKPETELPNAVHSLRHQNGRFDLLSSIDEARSSPIPSTIAWPERTTGSTRLRIKTEAKRTESGDMFYGEQTSYESDFFTVPSDGPFNDKRFVFDTYSALHSISLPVDGKSGQATMLAVSDHWMELFDADGRSLALDYSAHPLEFGQGIDTNGIERVVRRRKDGTGEDGKFVEELAGIKAGKMVWQPLGIPWDIACGRRIPELQWSQRNGAMSHPQVATHYVNASDNLRVVADIAIKPVLSEGKWYFDDVSSLVGFDGECFVTSRQGTDAQKLYLTWTLNEQALGIRGPGILCADHWSGFNIHRVQDPSGSAVQNPTTVRFDSVLAVADDHSVYARAVAPDGTTGAVYRVTRQGQLFLAEKQPASTNRLRPVLDGKSMDGWAIEPIRSTLTRPATSNEVAQ